MADEKCGATFDTADGDTFTCGLPAGHPGPVHADDGEHQWGDALLPDPAGQ